MSFKLLNVSGNAKTLKSDRSNKGFLTAILYLSPYKISGYNVCKKAVSPKSCGIYCLNKSGRGFTNVVQNARKVKTKLLFENRELFKKLLFDDLRKFVQLCKTRGVKPALRLNGTSDLDWDEIFPDLKTEFPEIQRYEYTKVISKMRKWLDTSPKNYHLTFSRHEKNEEQCKEVLEKGGNVAVVFKDKKFPKTFFNKYKVKSGDKTDLRFLEGRKSLVIALYAKGRAKHDTTGFVVR